MKGIILVITFLLLSPVANAEKYVEFESNGVCYKGKIYSQTESCIIVQTVDENGNFLYWVLGAIVETWAIDVAKAICMQFANEKICDLLSHILELAFLGKNIVEDITDVLRISDEFINWTLSSEKRGMTIEKFLYFSSPYLALAVDISDAMEAYGKTGVVKWEEVKSPNIPNYTPSNHYETRIFNNENNNRPIDFEYSETGADNSWERVNLNNGKYRPLGRKGNNSKLVGFIRMIGGNCIYRLEFGNYYNFIYNEKIESFEIRRQ